MWFRIALHGMKGEVSSPPVPQLVKEGPIGITSPLLPWIIQQFHTATSSMTQDRE